MIARWQDVRCASIPVEDLAVLADLRREAGIRVTLAQGRAWVSWDDGPGAEVMQRMLVGRLLPLPDVEIFARRDGRWYRPGQYLPAFDLPIGDGSQGTSLDRVILPRPLTMQQPGGDAPLPVRIRIVADDSERPRPAAAVRCLLADLAEWAQWAPSEWIESLSGAWCEASDSNPVRAEVLVIGPADPSARTEPHPPGRRSKLWHPWEGEPVPEMARTEPRPLGGIHLPAAGDGLRFWGCDVLIPLGCRAEPDLAPRALRAAVGAGPGDVVVLDDEGPELIPRQAFQPLSRAGIRLAMRVEVSAPSTGGGRP
jgi:MoxR-vWA-beta-propeller ternary system domain bpX2